VASPYSGASAVLTLEHNFPEKANVSALVDVRLVLETLKAEQTRVGEWVNVIGYISSSEPSPRKPKEVDRGHEKVHIQALILWSAGPLNIQKYEEHVALEEKAGTT